MDDNEALNEQLFQNIRSLEEEGLLDDQFGLVHSLKESNSPFFLAELIPVFCIDSQSALRNLTEILDQHVVDYYDIEEQCIKLKGATSCIGACRMTFACDIFRDAIDNQDKEGCYMALNGLKNEYYNLHDRLETILQLERRIVSHDGAM